MVDHKETCLVSTFITETTPSLKKYIGPLTEISCHLLMGLCDWNNVNVLYFIILYYIVLCCILGHFRDVCLKHLEGRCKV